MEAISHLHALTACGHKVESRVGSVAEKKNLSTTWGKITQSSSIWLSNMTKQRILTLRAVEFFETSVCFFLLACVVEVEF